MSWRDLMGNLLEKLDGPAPSLMPSGNLQDPFNYALALSLSTSATPDSVLQHLLARFPALSFPEAIGLLKKCDVLIHKAVLIYYKVHDGQLSETEAEAQVKQTALEMSQQNFSVLRVRCHMVASK